MQLLFDQILFPAHPLLHALVGGYILFFLLAKDSKHTSKHFLIFLLGAFVGIFPDIFKFFGIISAHSILLSPIFGLVLTLIAIKLIQNNFIKTWISITMTLIFGHILIDFFGNGVAILYPFISKEYSFYIIAHESIYVMFLLGGILIYLIKKNKKVLLMFFIIFCLTLSLLGTSKLILERSLNEQFIEENPYLIISYPSTLNLFEWNFHVRTKKDTFTGKSPYFPVKITITPDREK